MLSHQGTDHRSSTALISTFYLGDALWGIDAMLVQEVVRVGQITPVHHAPSDIMGVINLRGKIVTVLDLSEKLGLGAVSLTEESRIFIIDWQGEYLGMVVDQVADVMPVESERLNETPENVHNSHGKYVSGVYHIGRQLITMIDTEKVLADADSV